MKGNRERERDKMTRGGKERGTMGKVFFFRSIGFERKWREKGRNGRASKMTSLPSHMRTTHSSLGLPPSEIYIGSPFGENWSLWGPPRALSRDGTPQRPYVQWWKLRSSSNHLINDPQVFTIQMCAKSIQQSNPFGWVLSVGQMTMRGSLFYGRLGWIIRWAHQVRCSL